MFFILLCMIGKSISAGPACYYEWDRSSRRGRSSPNALPRLFPGVFRLKPRRQRRPSSCEKQRYLDVGGQRRADAAKCSVDIAGQHAHACDGRESDQKDGECVFDEVLAFFVPEDIPDGLKL